MFNREDLYDYNPGQYDEYDSKLLSLIESIEDVQSTVKEVVYMATVDKRQILKALEEAATLINHYVRG